MLKNIHLNKDMKKCEAHINLWDKCSGIWTKYNPQPGAESGLMQMYDLIY